MNVGLPRFIMIIISFTNFCSCQSLVQHISYHIYITYSLLLCFLPNCFIISWPGYKNIFLTTFTSISCYIFHHAMKLTFSHYPYQACSFSRFAVTYFFFLLRHYQPLLFYVLALFLHLTLSQSHSFIIPCSVAISLSCFFLYRFYPLSIVTFFLFLWQFLLSSWFSLIKIEEVHCLILPSYYLTSVWNS